MNKKTAIVIGAGVGGCSTAARLAKEGFKVTVYEKNSYCGGRCSIINLNGHRFDQGPSFYLMPKKFEELFSDLGENINEHIELLKCPVNYQIFFHDGKTFEMSCDISKLCEGVKAYEGDSFETSDNLTRFLSQCYQHYKFSDEIALKQNISSVFDVLTLKNLGYASKLTLIKSVYDLASKYFNSDHMKKAFTFQSMYLGMSPYEAPGTFNLLQGTEMFEGIWYPKGGFGHVFEVVEQIATKKFNAEFIYNCGVAKININQNKIATGVTLEDGKIVNADVIVCNADAPYAYNELLPKTSYSRYIDKKSRLSMSTISFYWCMKQKIPQLNIHNVFLVEKYKESFDEIFINHSLPDEISFYVNVPSRIDSTAAPENKDTIIILVPIGHLTDENRSKIDSFVTLVRKQVIEALEIKLKINNFAELIEHELYNNPKTWENKFNLWQGNALGLSHNILQLLFLRPSIKSSYKNLYMVGASIHPGTGVPIVISGSKLVTEEICRDFGLRKEKKDYTAYILWFIIIAIVSIILMKFFQY